MNTSAFFDLLLSFGAIMTAPTLKNFMLLASGFILSPRRRVTDALVSSGIAGKRHHAAFHRVFSAAQWSLDEMGMIVFYLAIDLLGHAEKIFLAIDDTLARKRGLKVYGVGMHHDPLLSSRKTKLVNWGHSWVVMGVLVRVPFRKDHIFCLPILFRLYRSKKTVERDGGVYKTRPELAVEMLDLACGWLAQRRYHLIADSAYCGKSVLKHLPQNCDMTGRAHLDAGLYDFPPKTPSRGRPRVRGKKLCSPRKMIARCKTRRMTVTVYGRREKVEVAERVCLWYRTAGKQALRIVAVRPLDSGRKEQAFFCTDLTITVESILAQYGMRWAIEVAFQDTKGWLGFEEPQGWSKRAVCRTAPVLMLLYSLILIWFAKKKEHNIDVLERPWYTQKKELCFADIFRALRREILCQRFLNTPAKERDVTENTIQLIRLAANAA